MTPWSKPTAIQVVLTGCPGEPSDAALALREDLIQRYTGTRTSQLTVHMVWSDETEHPLSRPDDTASEVHVLVVRGAPTGRLRTTSVVFPPGRLVYTYGEGFADGTRTYRYVLTPVSARELSSIDLRRALLLHDRGLEFGVPYREPAVVDEMISQWPDIAYDP